MILDINFRLRSYVLKLNLPNYYMIERSCDMSAMQNLGSSVAMESKEPRQINEFKVMDEHGNDYTVVEYQNVTETRSLKWRKAGPSWFGLATELLSARSTMKRSGLRQVTRSSADPRHDVASRHAAAYDRSSTLSICDVWSNSVDLGPKLLSAERALAAIRAGSRIYISTGCAAPRTLLARLEAMEPGPADLEFVSFLTTSALPQVAGLCANSIPPSGIFRRQRSAWFGGQRATGLCAYLAGRDTETADQRTATDRCGIASGFLA